jgi:predicted outer membrane repeat protein
LRLEALEDRCVPSTFAVVSADDNVAEMHTLRWAVAHAVSGDSILIAADLKDTPIVLTQGELFLNQSVTIEGLGNVAETISGGGMSRVFEVAAGANVTIENLTLVDGNGKANNPNAPAQYPADGGAILNDTSGTVTVSGCSFSGNSVYFSGPFGGSGGAVSNFGTMTLSNCTLSGNSAYFSGGGIENTDTGILTVSGSTLSGNGCLIIGGGIINQGILNVSNSTLSGNATDTFALPLFSGGGAIFNTNFESATGIVTINNCTLSGNTASTGGAVYNSDGTLTVSGSNFSGNSAVYLGSPTSLEAAGGAILEEAGTATVSGSTFSGNSAGNQGGAIDAFSNGTLTVLTVSGSTFSGNSAGNQGGAIYNNGAATVSGSMFTGNSASSGGGIYNDTGGTLTVSGSTFSANTPDNIFGTFIDGGGNTFS